MRLFRAKRGKMNLTGRFRMVFALCGILAGWSPLFAQAPPGTPRALTIGDAVQIALAENPAVGAAQQEHEAAQARARAARGAYYPQLRIDAIAKLGLSGATNGLGLLGLPASPLYRNLSDAGNVTQDIFDFGQRRHRVEQARAEVEAARARLAAVRIQVARDARMAFMQVLRAKETGKLREEFLHERQAVARKTADSYLAGLRSKLESDLAQVYAITAEVQLKKAREEERAAWTAFFAALGRPAQHERYELVAPTIEPVPPGEEEAEVKVALAERPDLKALEAEIRSQEEQLAYARGLRRPSLRGVFSGGYARFADLTPARLLAGGFGLTAPIFTGGQLEAQIQEAAHDLETLKARRAQLELSIRVEVSQARTELLEALEAAAANEQIARYAEEAARLARTRYEARLASFVDSLTAETASEAARADYVQALYDYGIARARLEAALGTAP